jgi:hypothetical protein
MGTPMDGAPIFVAVMLPEMQILRFAYPIDFVGGAPSHPKDVNLSLGTPTRCFAQDDTS